MRALQDRAEKGSPAAVEKLMTPNVFFSPVQAASLLEEKKAGKKKTQ